jgi:hypothetical protein
VRDKLVVGPAAGQGLARPRAGGAAPGGGRADARWDRRGGRRGGTGGQAGSAGAVPEVEERKKKKNIHAPMLKCQITVFYRF